MAEDDGIFFVIAALTAGVCFLLYLRLRHRVRDYPLERQWPGHSIDTTLISQRVRRLRNDYVAELQSRPHRPARGTVLLTLVRRAVARLPYFRGRQSYAASPKHGTENHAA
jgi:hypothetical protein